MSAEREYVESLKEDITSGPSFPKNQLSKKEEEGSLWKFMMFLVALWIVGWIALWISEAVKA